MIKTEDGSVGAEEGPVGAEKGSVGAVSVTANSRVEDITCCSSSNRGGDMHSNHDGV